jgi:SAM-dependent methyltransferase
MPTDDRCRVCGSNDWRVEISGIRDWEYGIAGSYDYCRCNRCGIVQIAPFPSLEELVKAYQIDYHGYAEATDKGPFYRVLFAANDWLFTKRLKSIVAPGAAVLDLGCGNGAFLQRVRSMGAGLVEGIDFSEQAVGAAAKRGIRVFHGVLGDFERPPATYDVIFMNNYLEHTSDPLAELRKCRQLLKPHGRLVGEVPNFDSFDRCLFGRYWGGNHVPRHTFQFDPPALRALLSRAGFRDARPSCELNTAHLVLSVQNLLQRNRSDLRHNPALKHGRAAYYGLLLLAFLPVNFFFVVAGKAGVMKFYATA